MATNRGRPSLDILQASQNRNASVPEGTAASQINEQVRRVSMEMTKRNSSDHAEAKQTVQFNQSHGLTSSEAEVLMQQWGRNELVEKSTPTWLIIFRLVNLNFFPASYIVNNSFAAHRSNAHYALDRLHRRGRH